jgi:hypothetical protein
MNQFERSKILRSKRGNALRELAGNMIVDADMLPSKSELKAALEELYPGEERAKLRATLTEKLTTVAEKAQNRKNRFPLRGIVSELVIQVETKLAGDDRLVAVPEEEPIDMDAVMRATDKYSDRIGGELERQHDKERAEAQEILRKAGYMP